MIMTQLITALEACLVAQNDATALWHSTEPLHDPECLQRSQDPTGALTPLVLTHHLRNFRLWHVEDEARRRDVAPEIIARCKQRIDGLNQERNDAIERVDTCLLHLLTPLLPSTAQSGRHNTESLGMAIDRLSILSLKIWHMQEQTQRTDVAVAHIETCQAKLAVLREQRQDLQQALMDLLGEFAAGTKHPKVYFQFKMYNDPALNPALYEYKAD